jgi:NADPH-dependent glutamate synthase beta subunit-like oxidoreductase/ferredoxin
MLKLAIPRDQNELIMCGDIGCFGLGALPPLRMIDTINHMGMSVSMAQGLNAAFHNTQENKKLVALVGDGTFFHSGISSLINAVYTRANILLIIFDNRTIGMTGHQTHPGAARTPKYHEIDIPPLLKGMGVEFVETFNPQNIADGFKKLHNALAHNGVSVLISQSPCIFLPDFKQKTGKMKIVVDALLCNSCANHEDPTLACSRCGSPKSNLSRAKAKLLSEIPVPGEEQLCPANICNHGFFNSVLEGDYKTAVEVVRDKMLFANTCGSICHRPCELFSERNEVVPIKALKKFVSGHHDNFRDFSLPLSRAQNAVKQNKTVAVIGAGPAGLSAAYDLIQAGYDVSVFEKETEAGGMIKYAIPDFRMDKHGFDFEATQLEEMGVRFYFNTPLGKSVSLKKLSAGFDAVILAIGLNKSRSLEIIEKNIPAEKRMDALSFLKSFNRGENPIKSNSHILVIGGGNSALDAARAAVRLHNKNTVMVSCIEKADAMPAFEEEIRHAVTEGVAFYHDSYVAGVAGQSSGKIEIMLRSFSNHEIVRKLTCDYVITAIGQQSDPHSLKEIDKSRVDSNTRVDIDGAFNGLPNLFVAGDVLSGNSMSVIGAIASGKKAAVNVRRQLENYPFEYEGTRALDMLNANPAVHPRQVSIITEKNIRQLAERYHLFQSCAKCNHCIDNFGCPAMIKVEGKVVIDQNRCTLCGLCIDVCPNDAIHWEKVNREKSDVLIN